MFVVPIQPRFHRLLFPEAELQLPLLPEPQPFGNAIRKAYLSNSGIRRLQPGDCLLFYRSQEAQGVFCVGVVEATLVSSDAAEVAAFVGQRTVYSFAQIKEKCADGEVLAILFRQDRVLTEPIGQQELASNRVMVRPPPVDCQRETGGDRVANDTDRRVALLSLHPRFADAIFDGEKKVELRRSSIAADVSHVVVYCTAPVQRIVGWFEVASIDRDRPTALWKRYRAVVGVSAREFCDYFDGAEHGTAIVVGSTGRLSRSAALEEIGLFVPPQSYRYLPRDHFRRLRRRTTA